MGGRHAERGTPVTALLVQAAIALALIVFGAFQQDGFNAMVEFTAPVFWFFILLTAVAVIVLRGREGQVPRPFKVPFYPITPILFAVVCGYLFYSSVTYAASQNAVHVSLGVMAVGVVALAITVRGSRGRARAAAGD
jgi:amino acid transporter